MPVARRWWRNKERNPAGVMRVPRARPLRETNSAAVEGLVENDFDAAITGGIDRNMGAPTFVKFCKIGALSATGSRPFAEGAYGFVMASNYNSRPLPAEALVRGDKFALIRKRQTWEDLVRDEIEPL